MNIEVEKKDGIDIVRISGDLRLWGKQDAADKIRETLHGLMLGGQKRIVLNITNVQRIDSRGIGCLARCHATAISQRAALHLVVGTGIVLDALKQLNFVKLYPIFSSEAAALEAFAQASAAGGPAAPA
jgi:anti-anti-sigma factor